MASSLKEYLKKYTSEPDNNNNNKKKKKPKNPANAKNIESGVRIVDEDPVWQAEVKDASSEDEDSPDEKPLIMEDVEIKRLKRLEQLRTRKPYLAVADDGSGWVTVSEPKKTENDNITSVSTRDRHDSPDLSPPRKVLSSASDLSPQRKQASRGSPDLSPARKEASTKSSDLSPPRKQQRDKSLKQKDGKWQIPDGSAHLSPSRKSSLRSSDLSPQRKFAKDKIINSNNDGRRARHDSPDLSPPRKAVRNSVELCRSRKKHRVSPDRRETQKRIRHDSPDLSSFRSTSSRSPDLSPRRARHDSPDLSPPRKVVRNSLVLSPSRRKQSDSSRDRRYPARRNRHDSPDLSPPRKVSLRSTSLSPPRNSSKDGLLHMKTEKRIGHHDSPDLSPPRKAVKGLLELSPSRKKQRYSSPDKMEATKRDRHDSPDLSHLQRSRWTSQDLSHERPQKEDKHKILHYEKSVSDNSKTIGRSVDITNAGLLSGEDFKEELDRKRREESDRFRKMDVSISGRSAGTVYRDKHGRKLEGLEEYMQLQKGQPKPEEKPLEWGKGITQKRQAEAMQAELELEKNKPFARSRDDPELDRMLRERVRWGDPMAHLVKRKKDEPILENLSEDEKMKESGFIVPQDIPNHSWLKRGIDPPPNRYGIKPGRHWDGVDRSNGFEKELFKRQNEKKATETEAYLWSVADM